MLYHRSDPPSTLLTAAVIPPPHVSFIDSKRKGLFHEDHTPKTFASDELKYFQEALERVKVLYEEFQKASNMLTTTHINLKRKFPSRFGRDKQSRRKKENKRKVKKKQRRRDYSRGHICF